MNQDISDGIPIPEKPLAHIQRHDLVFFVYCDVPFYFGQEHGSGFARQRNRFYPRLAGFEPVHQLAGLIKFDKHPQFLLEVVFRQKVLLVVEAVEIHDLAACGLFHILVEKSLLVVFEGVFDFHGEIGFNKKMHPERQNKPLIFRYGFLWILLAKTEQDEKTTYNFRAS